MKIATNFTLEECCKSQAADRNRIENIPNEIERIALIVFVNNILQPVRNKFGSFIPSSVFRTGAVCKLIGSSENSQHAKGEAADFEVAGLDNYELAAWIAENLEFDQLILEHYKKGVRNSGWVHCSFTIAKENRKEIRHTERVNDKLTYPEGLI